MITCFDDMIYRDEGKVYKAMPDFLTHGAPWTIGRGHTGPEVHEGLVWNDDQIEFAYQIDKNHAWQGCYDNFEPWFNTLNDPRQAVLAAMTFQMGIGSSNTGRGLLGFTQMLAAVRDQHFAHAAELMRQSVWFKQTHDRAYRMSVQMEMGTWQ